MRKSIKGLFRLKVLLVTLLAAGWAIAGVTCTGTVKENADGSREATVEVSTKSAGTKFKDYSTFTNFNAAYGYMDFSDSNVDLTSNTGTGTIKLLNGYNVIASKTFGLYRSGQRVYFTYPSQVTNWIAANGENADDVKFSYRGFHTTEKSGTNTITVEFIYDTSIVAGDSMSWYVNPDDGDDPPTHQQ